MRLRDLETELARAQQEIRKKEGDMAEELAARDRIIQQLRSSNEDHLSEAVHLKQQLASLQAQLLTLQRLNSAEDRTATAAFNAGGFSQMSLAIGDHVQITERHTTGWVFGRKFFEGAWVSGWFPPWAISK